MNDDNPHEPLWRDYLTGTLHPKVRLAEKLPSDPRCYICYMPFRGLGGAALRLAFNLRPSSMNPRMCNLCENFLRQYPGGAEVELTLLFADVRGSTRLAEDMSPSEFSRLMDRFYTVATHVIVHTNGLIEKFIGDEVAALYVPAYAGKNHARQAIVAARELMQVTGHDDPDGPWLPVGAGIHTGHAFVGALGSAGVAQITAVGDAPNIAARLASSAGPGEILISDTAYSAAGWTDTPVEQRDLELKGKSEPFAVHVLPVKPS